MPHSSRGQRTILLCLPENGAFPYPSHRTALIAVNWYAAWSAFSYLNDRKILVLLPCNYQECISSKSLENLRFIYVCGWIYYEGRMISSVHKTTTK